MARPRALTADQVRKIKADWKRSRGQRGMIAYLARKYDVSRGTIYNALESPTLSVKNPSKVPGQRDENPRIERSLVPSTLESENDGLSDEDRPGLGRFDCAECGTESMLPYRQTRHMQWCSRRGGA